RQHLDHDAAAAELADRLRLLGGVAAEDVRARDHDDVAALEAPEQPVEAVLPRLGHVGRGVAEALDRHAEGRQLLALLDDRRHALAGDDDADETSVDGTGAPDLVSRGDLFDVLAHAVHPSREAPRERNCGSSRSGRRVRIGRRQMRLRPRSFASTSAFDGSTWWLPSGYTTTGMFVRPEMSFATSAAAGSSSRST